MTKIIKINGKPSTKYRKSELVEMVKQQQGENWRLSDRLDICRDDQRWSNFAIGLLLASLMLTNLAWYYVS